MMTHYYFLKISISQPASKQAPSGARTGMQVTKIKNVTIQCTYNGVTDSIKTNILNIIKDCINERVCFQSSRRDTKMSAATRGATMSRVSLGVGSRPRDTLVNVKSTCSGRHSRTRVCRGPMRLEAAAGESIREEASHRGMLIVQCMI